MEVAANQAPSWFCMLTVKQALECVCQGDLRLTLIDLKDMYFQVPVMPEHRFSFRGAQCYLDDLLLR